mgnify:CR=1 FL=1
MTLDALAIALFLFGPLLFGLLMGWTAWRICVTLNPGGDTDQTTT